MTNVVGELNDKLAAEQAAAQAKINSIPGNPNLMVPPSAPLVLPPLDLPPPVCIKAAQAKALAELPKQELTCAEKSVSTSVNVQWGGNRLPLTIPRKINNGDLCINILGDNDYDNTYYTTIDTSAYDSNRNNLDWYVPSITNPTINPYTQISLKLSANPLNSPSVQRNNLLNPDPTYISSTYTNHYPEGVFYIRYKTSRGAFSQFNSSNFDSPTVKVSADSNKMIGPDLWWSILLPSPEWFMIQNEWGIKTKNNEDQILIMDFINNIYVDLLNLTQSSTVIYYAGYASKVLKTIEPFKSLLAGIPIDIIQQRINIFNVGLSDSSLNASVSSSTQSNTLTYDQNTKTSGSGTISPYNIPISGSTPPKYLCVPLFNVIRALWGWSSYSTNMIVDNNGFAIEAKIPDFSFISDQNKIVYRCYWWALNIFNLSIPTSIRNNFIKFMTNIPVPTSGTYANPFKNTDGSTYDTTVFVDAAAYFKAIYDNCYLIPDNIFMFGKPSNYPCQNCEVHSTTNYPYPGSNPNASYVCPVNCNGPFFCINSIPQPNSKILGVINSMNTSGGNIAAYTFCKSASAGASSSISVVPAPLPPPPPPPPPVTPPGVSPPPRLGATNSSTTVAIADKQTFLCQDRGVSNIYRYNKTENTKTKYATGIVAASYTPSMDLTSSSWVWSNSLDGVSLTCGAITLDLSTTISCPKGEYCGPPPSSSNQPKPTPDDSDDSDDSDKSDGSDKLDDKPTPNSTTPAISSVGSCILMCLCIVLIGVLIMTVMRKNRPIKKRHVKKLAKIISATNPAIVTSGIKKVGGYFKYLLDN